MAATVTGTPAAIAWQTATANPTPQNVTVAADATAFYMFWSYYANASGHGLASATLGGVAADDTFEVPGTSSLTATGVAVWYNPSTGTKSLDVSWDQAPVEGPTTTVICTKGGDTTAWRDADGDANTEANAVSVTLTTVAGDLVIKHDQLWNNDTFSTVPSLSAGWTNGVTFGQSPYVESARLSYIAATGATQVCDSENESYSTVVAISIPAAGGGGSTTILPQVMAHYYG